jgi:hypothetical protein
MSLLFFSANDTLTLPANVLKVLRRNTFEPVAEPENLSGVPDMHICRRCGRWPPTPRHKKRDAPTR